MAYQFTAMFWYAADIVMFSALLNIPFGTNMVALNTLFCASEMLHHSTRFIEVSVKFRASQSTLLQICFICQSVPLAYNIYFMHFSARLGLFVIIPNTPDMTVLMLYICLSWSLLCTTCTTVSILRISTSGDTLTVDHIACCTVSICNHSSVSFT